MWFKYGLKAQKLLAQGIALGMMAISKTPCKGQKLYVLSGVFKAFALTGRQVCVRNYPGRCPGLGASALSGRVGQNLRKFSLFVSLFISLLISLFVSLVFSFNFSFCFFCFLLLILLFSIYSSLLLSLLRFPADYLANNAWGIGA